MCSSTLISQYDIRVTSGSGANDLTVEQVVYSNNCNCHFALGSINGQAAIRRVNPNGTVPWTQTFGPASSKFTDLADPEGRANVVAAVGLDTVAVDENVFIYEVDCNGIVQFSNFIDILNPTGTSSRVIGTKISRTEDGHGGYWIGFNNSPDHAGGIDNPAFIKIDINGNIDQDQNGTPIAYEYDMDDGDDQLHDFDFNVGSQTVEMIYYDPFSDGKEYGMMSLDPNGGAIGAYDMILPINNNSDTIAFRPVKLESQGSDNFVVGYGVNDNQSYAFRFNRVFTSPPFYAYQTQFAQRFGLPFSLSTPSLSLVVSPNTNQLSMALARTTHTDIVNMNFQGAVNSVFRKDTSFVFINNGGLVNGVDHLMLFGNQPADGNNDYILQPTAQLNNSCQINTTPTYIPTNLTVNFSPNGGFIRTPLPTNIVNPTTNPVTIISTVVDQCPTPSPAVNVCQINCMNCAYLLSSEDSVLPVGGPVTYAWTISLNGVVEMTSTDPNVVFVPSTDPATYDYTLTITDGGVSSTINGTFNVQCVCAPSDYVLTSMQHVVMNGNTISRSHPGSGWTAGASTSVTLNTDDYVSYRVSENTPLMVGLSPTAPSIDWQNMYAAFYTMWNNRIFVNRGGALQLLTPTYSTNDEFVLSLTATDVEFYFNGTMVSSRPLPTTGQSMEVDIAIWSGSGEIYDLEIVSGCPFTGNTNIDEEEEEEEEQENELRAAKAKAQDDFKLFPNPTSTAFVIEYLGKEKEAFEYRLYDATGQVIEEHKSERFEPRVKFKSLDYPTGIYFLNVISPSKGLLKTERVIIE